MKNLSRLAAAAAWTLLALPAAHAAPAPKEDAAADAAANAPEGTVNRAIAAAIAGNFDKYLAELHPDRKETAEQRSQLQRYEWKRFTAQAAWYVADPAKPVVTVARRQEVSNGKIKLFLKDLKNKDAMPRPIELTLKDNRWLISSNSL